MLGISYLVILVLAFGLLFGVNSVFAESHNVPPVYLESDLTIYSNGSHVVISGQIKNYDSSAGKELTFLIKSPDNNIVTQGQVTPSSDGSFEFTFTAGGNLWKLAGDYIVEAKYGADTGETTINYIGGEQVISTPEPEPTEPEPTPQEELEIPAPFVDTSKDPQSYVDRYFNESSFKRWFDDNYPQYSSIYQAVGLEESISEPEPPCGAGTELVNDICQVIKTDEPEPTPDPEPEKLGIVSFVDKSKDPQSYIDRYNNEPAYKKWFDENYPEYDSIEQAVGLELTQKIPDWVKNIFGWYAQDQISEDELLSAIKYLIDEGILVVKWNL